MLYKDEMFKQLQYEHNNPQKNNSYTEKIDSIVRLQRPYIQNLLKNLMSKNSTNAQLICDYILSDQTQFNIRESAKEGKIKVLVWLSNYFANKVDFRQLTKENILSYLNNLRKPISKDPTQRWIGSYNCRQLVFSSFFRWLYDREELDPKKRLTPSCMIGIRRLPTKEKTHYKPSDLFTSRNNEIFLKHCPSSRDRCYHSMAIDTSARPNELLNLRIKDIIFKISDEGVQYAEITIKGGKSFKPRTVPLIYYSRFRNK